MILGWETARRSWRFLSQCFRQKRKMLRNNLAGVYGKDVIDGWPEAGLRAEQITLEQFAEMYRRNRKKLSTRLSIRGAFPDSARGSGG